MSTPERVKTFPLIYSAQTPSPFSGKQTLRTRGVIFFVLVVENTFGAFSWMNLMTPGILLSGADLSVSAKTWLVPTAGFRPNSVRKSVWGGDHTWLSAEYERVYVPKLFVCAHWLYDVESKHPYELAVRVGALWL